MNPDQQTQSIPAKFISQHRLPHPIFGYSVTDINNLNFGRITTHPANAGNCIIVIGGPINF